MTNLMRYAIVAAFAGAVCLGAGTLNAAELPKDANTTCPVMTKEEVDADLFVDYKGERVFLCCTKCKKKFNQDPEKYMKRIRDSKAEKKAGIEAKPAK